MSDLLNETTQSQASARKEPMKKSELSIIDEASAYVKKYSDLESSQMSMQSTTSKKKTAAAGGGLVKKIELVKRE